MDVLANPYAVVLAGVLAAGALYYLFGGGLGKRSRSSYRLEVKSVVFLTR